MSNKNIKSKISDSKKILCQKTYTKGGHGIYFLDWGINWGKEKNILGGGDTAHIILMRGTNGGVDFVHGYTAHILLMRDNRGWGHRTTFIDEGDKWGWGHRTIFKEKSIP